LSDRDRATLTDLGVEIQEYVPDNTYLCRFRPTDLAPIGALPFVVWTGVYLRGFKINPSLRQTGASPFAATGQDAKPLPPSRKKRTVDVVLHDDVDPASPALTEQIVTAARLDPHALKQGRRKVRMTVEQEQFDRLAELDQVRHIEEVPERQLFNNVSRQIIDADVVVNSTSYQGDGEVIAIADTGFDVGSTTDVHPAFTGRVANLYALGRPDSGKTDDPHGHGTHVAGSVLGDGTSNTMGGSIQGTAPLATLVLQSTLDSANQLGGIPTDLHDLFQEPYDKDGARVHTNSWGAVAAGLPYDASAREIDDFVWEHPDLVVCFAAGNSGTDANNNGVIDLGSVGSQAAAKNCITVGASESNRPDFHGTYGQLGFPADPVKSDVVASDPDGLAAFSSRGPTNERRIKPDVVAPGTCILSTKSRRVASASTRFGKSADPMYFFESGTSMATPLVAGSVAVLRETLVKNGTANPSAALIKALLINGAVELAGQYTPTEAGPAPNNNSGFGRVDLAGSVIIPGPDANSGFGEKGPLKQGEEDSFMIDVPARSPRPDPTATGVTLKITLVWTDPPGAALQNDLDLIVRAANRKERHGNMGTREGFDRTNNVEQILWTDIPPGQASVIVRAFQITNFPQPYAYAWRVS
jgi:subtilisin family serine protease